MISDYEDRDSANRAFNNVAIAKHHLLTEKDQADILKYLDGALSWRKPLLGVKHPMFGRNEKVLLLTREEVKSVDSENKYLLFELHGKDGHIWKLYENGQIEGFPDGTVIINRAAPLLALLRTKLFNLSKDETQEEHQTQ